MADSYRETEKVVLLPQTVEYYQEQLTGLLENEQYGQAKEMLRFLIGCGSGDPRNREEWASILAWLEAMFPIDIDMEPEDEEESEEDILRIHLSGGGRSKEREYAGRLIEWFGQGRPLDKQLAALDQLSYVEHTLINDTLIRWLAGQELPPSVQFKALQILKRRGAAGSIAVRRDGGSIVLEPQDTPLSVEEFPERVREIGERSRHVADMTEPSLSYFAEEAWTGFVSAIYGTALYNELAAIDEPKVDAWAAALHFELQGRTGVVSDEEQIWDWYAITEPLKPVWRRAAAELADYLEGRDDILHDPDPH